MFNKKLKAENQRLLDILSERNYEISALRAEVTNQQNQIRVLTDALSPKGVQPEDAPFVVSPIVGMNGEQQFFLDQRMSSGALRTIARVNSVAEAGRMVAHLNSHKVHLDHTGKKITVKKPKKGKK